MTRAIIDRVEENLVVLELENQKLISVARSLLTSEPSDGDVVEFNGHCWQIDREATKRRRQEIASLIKEISTQTANNDE